MPCTAGWLLTKAALHNKPVFRDELLAVVWTPVLCSNTNHVISTYNHMLILKHTMTARMVFFVLLRLFSFSFRAQVWRRNGSRREILTTAARWWGRARSVSCAPLGKWWERWFGWFCPDPSRQPECRSGCCCTGTPSTPGPGSTQRQRHQCEAEVPNEWRHLRARPLWRTQSEI